MEKLKQVIILIAAGLIFVSFAADGKLPGVLLQEGIYAEETEGDLEKAIGIYEQIIAEHEENFHVAAKAAYQLGMCHLKKGEKDKAIEYFQEVVDYYPEQRSIVEKANEKIIQFRPPQSNNITQEQVIAHLIDFQKKSYVQAKEEGVKLNTIVYYVDPSLIVTQGCFITLENDTGQTINDEIAIGNIGSSSLIELYNENLSYQQFRIEKSTQYDNVYTVFWVPDTPMQPGEIRTLIGKYAETPLLKTATGGYQLNMSNHFGNEVLENFLVILPEDIKITNGLDNLKSHQRIANLDMYLWQSIVPANTTNEKRLQLEIRKNYPEAARPVVIESFPQTYANNVNPDLNEISVTFDQDMHQYGWAWCRTGNPDIYPEVTGQPSYIDARTCNLPVKLAPAKAYLILINLKPYDGFKNTDMIPAKTYAIVFATRDINGNPTEIPEEMLKEAKGINKANSIPEPILDIVPPAVRKTIANHFRQTYETALEKGLRTNSHVHILDKDMNRNFGMVQVYHNRSNVPVDYEVTMGSNDSPEMHIYDENGVRQKIRTFKVPGSNYRFFWKPSEPVLPDEKRMLFYSSGTAKLNADKNGLYPLRLQNHYGAPVIETFYVITPSNVKLADQSEEPSMHKLVDGFNVYCWSKEQTERNVTHRVDIKLSK